MPEWLHAAVTPANHAPPPMSIILARVVLAVLLGFVVAAVYRLTLGRRSDSHTLPTTLVLLSVLIALVTVVIGDSVARAFGLVGALSIVRFRTVVEDTRDTAFVIFAVVVGMAAGAGYGDLIAVGVPAVAAAAAIMGRIDRPAGSRGGPECALTVRFGLGHDPDAALAPAFGKYLTTSRSVAAATVQKGAGLEVTYSVRMRDPTEMPGFVTEINRVEGVQGVEMKERAG